MLIKTFFQLKSYKYQKRSIEAYKNLKTSKIQAQEDFCGLKNLF